MFCIMLAARKYLATIAAVCLVTDIVVGSIILGNKLSENSIFPKGVRFGFYTTDETKG